MIMLDITLQSEGTVQEFRMEEYEVGDQVPQPLEAIVTARIDQPYSLVANHKLILQILVIFTAKASPRCRPL